MSIATPRRPHQLTRPQHYTKEGRAKDIERAPAALTCEHLCELRHIPHITAKRGEHNSIVPIVPPCSPRRTKQTLGEGACGRVNGAGTTTVMLWQPKFSKGGLRRHRIFDVAPMVQKLDCSGRCKQKFHDCSNSRGLIQEFRMCGGDCFDKVAVGP